MVIEYVPNPDFIAFSCEKQKCVGAGLNTFNGMALNKTNESHTGTEQQRRDSGHSAIILQSETADFVQGSVVGEVHTAGTLVANVEADNKNLFQTLHGEENLSIYRLRV